VQVAAAAAAIASAANDDSGLLCRSMSVATQAAALADAPAAPVLPYRVGHGFDLHRLAEGYKLVIGGVEIPHIKGCEAHSDGKLSCNTCAVAAVGRLQTPLLALAGDVLLHTVTDAILGALSLPDIGKRHIPATRGVSPVVVQRAGPSCLLHSFALSIACR